MNPYDSDFASLSSGNTPTAENEMFASLGIRATKTIRKMYQKNPQTVVCYAASQDLGFTDSNILQRTALPQFYLFLCKYLITFSEGEITYTQRRPLKSFVADMLALSNQKTV